MSCGEVRGNETAGAVTRSTTIHLATTSGMLDQAKVSDHSALAFVSGLAETGADRHFFVSPANPTWLKSNLIQEKLSDGVIWQNEKGLFCAWGHRELEHATCFGEFNDDHCFHVTNKVKRDIRRNVRGILDDDELYRKAKSEGANEDNKQPAKGTQEPKKNDKQPAKGTPEPKKEDKQPAEGTQEPKSVTKQPASETRELDKKGKQPASETQELDKKSGEEESSSSSSPSSHRPFGPSFPLGPALMSCHGFSKKDFKVMEVFSPPGISSEATSRGFSSTSVPAFDIKCGWDFINARHRARFWQLLRTEKPDFVSISPRCTAFSVMMNSNWDRMDEDKKKKLQAECMAMLQFSVQVACFQLEAGRTFLLEQPGGASSWACHAMKWLLEQPGTVRFLFDQCMAGLSVSEDGSLSRKTTGIATNHLGIACLLSSLQCDGSHQHVPLESGLPLKAQEYPEKMVKCIVDGLELGIQPSSSLSSMSGQSFPTIEDEDDGEEDLEDALDREVDRAGQPLAAARPLSSPLSDIQKEKIMRVHVNMGHLSKQQMLILFKAAGAKPEAMSYVKEKFQCSQCMRQKRPVEARRAAFPRTFSFNRFVGVDCFFINFQGKTRCFLNMICLGTNLQVVIWLRDYEAGSPSSLSVWKAFQDAWLRPFGSPEVVQCDGGSEFKGRYERGLEQLGCLQVVSDAASPWQNSKVERHGGWLKTKAEEELQTGSTVVGSPEDLEELLIQTAMAKNQHFSVGGFSPMQMVFGQNPRLPLEILSEDGLQEVAWSDADDTIDGDTPAATFAKAYKIRARARELCFKYQAKEKIRLSGNQRKHTQRSWSIGQWVYVWRRVSGSSAGHLTRSRWTGPGVVVLQAGHTVWVSMRSRLWKCNSDQLRPATHYESVGADIAHSDELRDIMSQAESSRTGAIDVSRDGAPPAEETSGIVPSPLGEPAPLLGSQPLQTIHEEEPDQSIDEIAPPLGQPVLRDIGQPDANMPPEPISSSQNSARTMAEPLSEPGSIASSRISSGESRTKIPRVAEESANTGRTNEPGRSSSEAVAPPGASNPSTPRSISSPATPGGTRVRRQVSEIEQLERAAAQEIRRLNRANRNNDNWLSIIPNEKINLDHSNVGQNYFALDFRDGSFMVGTRRLRTPNLT